MPRVRAVAAWMVVGVLLAACREVTPDEQAAGATEGTGGRRTRPHAPAEVAGGGASADAAPTTGATLGAGGAAGVAECDCEGVLACWGFVGTEEFWCVNGEEDGPPVIRHTYASDCPVRALEVAGHHYRARYYFDFDDQLIAYRWSNRFYQISGQCGEIPECVNNEPNSCLPCGLEGLGGAEAIGIERCE
jgi:hypothetical protein